MSTNYIYISANRLERWGLHDRACTLLGDEDSLIYAEDWAKLCELAGSEEKLMAELQLQEVGDAG